MKRKWLVTILSLMCVIACAVGLAACGDKSNNGNGGGNGSKVGGTYYYCENDVTDDTMYIVFKNGVWTDDENETGEYTLSGNNITLYVTLGGNKEEFASGSVSGDDITLDMFGSAVVYRKGEDISSKPPAQTLKYALSEDRTYYIVKGIGGLTGDIVIPDEWKKKPVTEIAENAFASCGELTGIVVGNNVETVGKKAFYNCSELKSATLGESVNGIAESTFEECRKLESVTIPSTVASIEKNAFTFCLALKDVYFTGTASDWAQIEFYYDMRSQDIQVSNPLSDNNIYIVGNNTANADHRSRDLYLDNELATEIEITDTQYVSPVAFKGYKGLKALTIGDTVTEIGEYAFDNCSELETLLFTGGSLETIGKSAFNRCSKLFSAHLPDSVTKIEQYAFNECENLTSVKTGDGVFYIGDGAFMGCAAMSALTLGSSVAEIGEGAFYGCGSLTSINIPSSAIFIGKDAFFGTELSVATFGNTRGWQVLVGNRYEDVENLDDTANAAALLKNSVLMNPEGYSDYDWEIQTLKFTLSGDGTYYIVSNNGRACRSKIEIPAEHNGKPVKEIGDSAFKNCTALTSVKIPESVTSIGNLAFGGCDNLTNITIPNSVASIGDDAFYDCNKLQFNEYDNAYYLGNDINKYVVLIKGKNTSITSCTIHENTKIIYSSAFSYCSSLTSIAAEENNPNYASQGGILYNKAKTKIIYVPLHIEGNVTIPSGVTSIGGGEFYERMWLTSINIPESVTSIGDYAFYDCSSLTDITIPNSVTSIGRGAFSDCNKLQFNEYDNAYYLGNDTNKYVVLIEAKDTSITSCAIYENTKFICDCAFSHCSSLIDITIPNSVTSIEMQTFYGCSSLTDITIPNSVTSIGMGAFYGCGLTSIIVPNSVTHIDINAFGNCNSMTSISIPFIGTGDGIYNMFFHIFDADKRQIPESLKTVIITGGTCIGIRAFEHCRGITSVILPNSVASIEEEAFFDSGITSMEIPTGVTGIGNKAFGSCYDLTSITVENGNVKYHSANNCVIETESKTLIVGCKSSIIPTDGSVTGIGKEAFYNCNGLTSITIPNSITNIGRGAFEYCHGLTSITIPFVYARFGYIFNSNVHDNTPNESVPESLKDVIITGGSSIGQHAFDGCKYIRHIEIPDSVTDIGSGAFNGCESLTRIKLSDNIQEIGYTVFQYCHSLTDITIPNRVTNIWHQAFERCGLKSITIPNSVNSIGNYAFGSCISLTSITFNGTKEQWGRITKISSWDNDTGNYTIYCTNGNIYKSDLQ